jgi:hypothetical protein
VPTPCRFCGATNRKITNEHVWSAWLVDFMPSFTGLGHSERWGSTTGRQQWRQSLLTATVRVFCDVCNNGWMSDIEAAAKPVVGPMVAGRAMTLDGAAQRTVANWVVLKGIVAVQTSRTEQFIPANRYGEIYSAKGAPANTVHVWLGCRNNLVSPTHPGRLQLFDSHLMPLTNVPRGFPTPPWLNEYVRSGGTIYATIFQVGHVFGLAFHHQLPGLEARPIPGSVGDGAFASIWPAGGDVRWPPPHAVDGLGDPHRVTQFFAMKPPDNTPP